MPEVDDLNPPFFEAAARGVGAAVFSTAARRRCLQLARLAIGTTQLCCLEYRASPKSNTNLVTLL